MYDQQPGSSSSDFPGLTCLRNLSSHPIGLAFNIAEDSVYEAHRGRQVTLSIELRLPCLLQDKTLHKREQYA
jgi:hypothetical protein